MTGDAMRRVATGDKVALKARWYNDVTKTVRDGRQDRLGVDSPTQAVWSPDGLVFVQNNSGSQRNQFEVLGINAAATVIDPSKNLSGFKNQPILSGVTPVTPTHTGLFVICAQPIASGAIGKAFLFAACPVQVLMNASGDKYADVKNNDPTQLSSGSSGVAQILAVQSGTGTKWALVRLGGGSGGTSDVGQYQYQVKQMVAQLVPGWDMTRAHPLI